MSIFEQSSPRGRSRFGKLSSNMFFVRNTAKPKRVHHIEGLNGALICNVNDDPSLIRSSSSASLNFNRSNLPTFETPRRVERLVPPTNFWNTYGIIHDTERWKQELASLATASGLGVQKEERKSPNKVPQTTATPIDPQHAPRSGAHYSTKTGRFNEGTAKSRGRSSSRRTTAPSDILFSVPENEREMWMLQVLCQLLNTSNLQDVQSWLVSATQAEKDQARLMINSALRGLKESERTSHHPEQTVDLNALSNFVERQKNEEKYASQKYLKESFNKPVPSLQFIDEEQQTDISLNDPLDTARTTSNVSQQTLTTYKLAYPHYNQRINNTATNSITSTNYENERNQEQIDTIQLDDDRQQQQQQPLQQSQSTSSIKIKKPSRIVPTLSERPPSSHKTKHQVESMQINDDGLMQSSNIPNENDDHQQQKETKPSTTQDTNTKTMKIRHLETKLTRQEEETKKKLEELQSKQSRLENAIKLLVKQTSAYKTRQPPPKNEQVEDLDAPVVNVIIKSPRETNMQDKTTKQQEPLSVQLNGKSKKSSNDNIPNKIGDYTIEDVKVQISLSRLDNHPPKVYSGIWKPDASTLNRLQGN